MVRYVSYLYMTRRKRNMTSSELALWLNANHTVNENSCWVWKGAKNSAGYGCYGLNGRMHLIHRFSLETKLGRHLTDTEDTRHVCPTLPNRACYNPSHLEVGTRKENMQDMVRTGRSQVGTKNYHSKLTEDDVISIRAQRSMFTLRQLSEMYGVDQALISMISNGKIWRHLGGGGE
jgi:hypothetical protein